MRIAYYSRQYLTLWIESGNAVYEYKRVNPVCFKRLKGWIEKGVIGKCWQLLRNCGEYKKVRWTR